ncbi:MAG: ATP-binding protein [Candidatus Midichloria sp.]|nr:ATP-binding protein [Candidatus Midichloria sp.]
MALDKWIIFPRSLFGRFFLIIVIPVIIIQLVTAYIFYQRHWDNVNRHMQHSLVSELTFLVKLIDGVTNQMELERIIKNWQIVFLAKIEVTSPLKYSTKRTYADRYKFDSLKTALESSLNRQISLYYISERGLIGCDIPLAQFNLHTEFSGRRIHSPTTYVFISWVVATSALLVIIAILFMRNQVRSILKLTEAANKFGSGQKVVEFRPTGAHEIRTAGFALIKMKKRLERNIQNRSEVLTHISHDLRTPITRMKLKLAMCQNTNLSTSLETNLKEMEELLSRYLKFAKGEGNEESQLADINEIILERIYNFHDPRISYTSKETNCRINIKTNAVKRVIDNVINNACKFGKNNVVIELRCSEDLVIITIEDDGPGIEPELHKKVFEPFFRMNENKEGFGLGLAIVKTIVQAHGGFINLSSSTSYGGLKIQISLPRL